MGTTAQIYTVKHLFRNGFEPNHLCDDCSIDASINYWGATHFGKHRDLWATRIGGGRGMRCCILCQHLSS